MTGIAAFLEILHRAGVRHIFGNPGTTELPLNDALVEDDRFRYLFGLHEIPVVAMADGFALASGQIAVANVHVSCGLGNALGMLYNAHVEGTPLLLTAGQQDRRLLFDEPVLSGDLVSVTRPWTKWSVEVHRVEDIPNAVRRAIQIALTPPTGPVFLALPIDVQMETRAQFDCAPPSLPDFRVRPGRAGLERAAQILGSAHRPVIVAGSRVLESGASAELMHLAEKLGAPIYAPSATMHGRLPVPSDHALYAGTLPLWSPEIREVLADHDVLFAVGVNLLRLYIHHEPSRPIPEHLRIVQLDNDPRQLGKNFPVEAAVWGDPKAGLAELAELVPTCPERHARIDQVVCARQVRRQQLQTRIERERDARPLTALTMMNALVKGLPHNVAVVEEAATTHQGLLEWHGVFHDPTGHFAHRGWALGWGLGCALGVKLAWPHRPVLALLGDGASLYGIQGLWSAAHYQIPVTFVICNNSQYKILKACGDHLPLPNMKKHNYLAMDLTEPSVDFVGLAKAFGVDAVRIGEPEELTDELRKSLTGDRPLVIEVPIG